MAIWTAAFLAVVFFAVSKAPLTAGKAREARMAMIEMTTSNSMRVKACGRVVFFVVEVLMWESWSKGWMAASLESNGVGDEVVGLGTEDFGVDEGADFGGLGEDDAAIDFGGVVLGAAGVGGFHKDAEGLAGA